MNLQTKIPLAKQSNNLIDYNTNALLIGSCFVENMGSKLSYFKFQNLQNPFGILFQPKAIEVLISKAIHQKRYLETDVFFHNERWHCFEAHSKLSALTKEKLLFNLNKQLDLTASYLNHATHIVITLGTAWVYRFLETNQLVANCHKVPQKQFGKELLSVEDISESLQAIVNLVRSVNSKAAIIFTVSPVRHLKDGFIENTQSKSHLITALHQLLNSKGLIVNHNCFYFPSYEIMMDELRDYRFYAEDMVHPNQIAINYIWELFQSVWMSDETLKLMNQVDVVQKGLQHKPFNPDSDAHKKFLQKVEAQKMQLQTKFPNINFT
ncbi:GSCFA domain-containing protein [Mariniflexile sp.]|uniref:GSCFA domain-containing protein n=1 Tax=Mariniflexile sp. TaxID=1979402 RepID=UPI0035644128